jgi:hypothetical protein
MTRTYQYPVPVLSWNNNLWNSFLIIFSLIPLMRALLISSTFRVFHILLPMSFLYCRLYVPLLSFFHVIIPVLLPTSCFDLSVGQCCGAGVLRSTHHFGGKGTATQLLQTVTASYCYNSFFFNNLPVQYRYIRISHKKKLPEPLPLC